MSTFRKLFSEDRYQTYHKQDHFPESKERVTSPVGEKYLLSENPKFLNVPQNFSNISSYRVEDQRKAYENIQTNQMKPISKGIYLDEEKFTNKIIVVGFDSLYFNNVLSHFKRFGKILDFEYSQNTNFIIINYSSPKETKYALDHYNRFMLNLTKENVIVAEPYYGELRPQKYSLEEENMRKTEKKEEKYSTISTPSKHGLYKLFEYIFNW